MNTPWYSRWSKVCTYTKKSNAHSGTRNEPFPDFSSNTIVSWFSPDPTHKRGPIMRQLGGATTKIPVHRWKGRGLAGWNAVGMAAICLPSGRGTLLQPAIHYSTSQRTRRLHVSVVRRRGLYSIEILIVRWTAYNRQASISSFSSCYSIYGFYPYQKPCLRFAMAISFIPHSAE